MSGINRSPSGLLSFFGIKNTGRNPAALQEVLSPTLDLVNWYLIQNSESVSINGAVAAIGLNTLTNVPETETWAILACAVNSVAAMGAGQGLLVGGAWARNPNALTIYPLTVWPGLKTVTAGEVAVSWSRSGDVTFAPPGAVLGFYCGYLTAGPITCTMNLTIVRMTI